MSTLTANNEPGGDAARVRCLYCGANNFPASPVCWQCGRPLKAAPAGAGAATGPAAALFPSPAGPTATAAPRLPLTAETGLATKAAAALGLTFPYVGLPVGIVFLMLDDPRKTQLGWATIGWSVVGSVLNAIALAATVGPLIAALKMLAPHGAGGAAPSIPGLPDMGGGDGLLLPRLLAWLFLPLHA